MGGNSSGQGVYALLRLTEDAVQSLIEAFKDAHEDSAIIWDDFGSTANHWLQRMPLSGCLLFSLHYN
jgi:hypothetical protein